MKLVFAPIGILTGLLAGVAAQKIFERLWAVIDDEEPPAPDQRLDKGITDHGVRSGVTRLTGRWPGEERPDPA